MAAVEHQIAGVDCAGLVCGGGKRGDFRLRLISPFPSMFSPFAGTTSPPKLQSHSCANNNDFTIKNTDKFAFPSQILVYFKYL